MRHIYIVLLITVFSSAVMNGQVKIGDNPQNIDPSSVLELESTDKVLVITRVTTAQMNAIVPSQGALCFNTDLQSVHYYNGTQWVNIGGSSGTGGPLSADAIVNTLPTIVITPTATGDNLEVAPNSIRSEQIVDGGVNGVDIQDGSIGPGKIQDNSVTQDKLSENSVGAFALDNDNIGVSAFNNDVGYLTASDINIVSPDVGNVLEDRANGVFYDNQPLITAINQNTDAIALDEDQSDANEIQSPTLTGTEIGLTGTAGTIDIGPLVSAGGSDDQNLETPTLSATNVLTLNIEGGNPTTVDLSALAGGGSADGSETKINAGTNITVTGDGTDAMPYVITATEGGTGGTPTDLNFDETTNILTLTNPATVGNQVDLSSLEGGGTGTDNQTLSEVLTEGNDADAALIKNIADPEEAQDAATKAYVDATVTSGGSLANGSILVGGTGNAAQQLVLNGDATLTNTAEITIADNVIESNNILNATILAEDLNRMGATNGQILIWEADDVDVDPLIGSWVPSPAGNGGSVVSDDDTIEGTGAGAASALKVKEEGISSTEIADATILAEDLNRMDATNGQILVWQADDVDVDPLIGSWVASNNNGTVVADDDTIEGTGMDASTALKVKEEGISSTEIEDATILAEDLNRMDAQDGEILIWKADDVDVDPLVGSWVASENVAHTGTAKSIFFAGDDGLPRQFFHPNGQPSFFWDYDGRVAGGVPYGTLAIGVDGAPPFGNSDVSNDVKVHIAEYLNNQVAYPLLVQNQWDSMGASSGSGVGIMFASDRFPNGKGSLVFERRDEFGVGDFHLLLNSNNGAIETPALATDKAFTVTKEKNIGLYGGIDIGGAGTGFGLNNQVLASGGPGAPVKWVAAGGGSSIPTGTNGAIFFSNGTGGLLDSPAELFWNNTNNRLGIGTNNPDRALEVVGEIKSTAFASAQGTATEPAYSFHTGGDTNTGMYRPNADELGFSVGGFEALRIDEPTLGNTKVVVNQSLELDGNLIDENNETGAAGQVLSATATGTDWVAPSGPAQKGKVSAGSSAATGAYDIVVTGQTNDNYIINLSVVQNGLGQPVIIQIVSQTQTQFSVQILQFDSATMDFIATDADWHYTIFSNP